MDVGFCPDRILLGKEVKRCRNNKSPALSVTGLLLERRRSVKSKAHTSLVQYLPFHYSNMVSHIITILEYTVSKFHGPGSSSPNAGTGRTAICLNVLDVRRKPCNGTPHRARATVEGNSSRDEGHGRMMGIPVIFARFRRVHIWLHVLPSLSRSFSSY